MRLQNIMMTEELAKQIDDLLRMATSEKMQAIAPVSNNDELNEYKAIGELLDSMGYAKRIGGNIFSITPSGMLFVKNGGFTIMYQQQKESNQKDEEIARLNKELTLRQIDSSKREKWLILWEIVSTLATIVLSYFQLTKSCL